MIFDTISVKARWAHVFYHTESVAMTPKSHDHMPTTSLWGVAAKWPTQALKMKLILCPRDPQGYSCISLSLSGRILKEYRNIVSASKQTPCGISWGLRNHTHWSARYTNGRDAAQQESSFELYKFNPLSPHSGLILRGSSCIVIPGVICELLQFTAKQ